MQAQVRRGPAIDQPQGPRHWVLLQDIMLYVTLALAFANKSNGYVSPVARRNDSVSTRAGDDSSRPNPGLTRSPIDIHLQDPAVTGLPAFGERKVKCFG